MKRYHFGLTCATVLGMAVLVTTASNAVFGFHHGRAVVVTDDCEYCESSAYTAGSMYAAGPARTGMKFKRALPAPVYFGNTYPEYLYGNPNIYAGFDEYDTDIEFVSPVIGKSPFHYNYYNDQYNNSPYYGKNWDKNWTITGQNGVQNAAPVNQSAAGSNASAGTPSQSAIKTDGNAAVLQSDSDTANANPNTEVNYDKSPSEDAYRGHFIYNFESFCDNDPPCCLTQPITGLFNNLLGGCGCCCLGGNSCANDYAVSEGTYEGGCENCRAFSGNGGYGGFNCPEYRYGNSNVIADQYFVEGEFAETAVVDGEVAADPCATCCGIYVDSCAGCDNGVFIDNTAAVTSSNQDAENADEQKNSENEAKESESKELTDNAETDASQASEKNSSVKKEEGTPASTQKPAVPDSEPAKESAPAEGEGDAFPELSEPITTQETSSEKTTGMIQICVPEDSVVVINGYRTKLTGAVRTFLAKDLTPGEVYTFEIRVVAEKNGQIYTGVKETELRAGQSAEVAFQSRDLSIEKELTYASK